MTAPPRAIIAATDRLRPFVVCLMAGVLLTACNNFKQVVGIEPTPPDEFAVEQRAPLTIPPDFQLRPPQPGAARPQETNVTSKAQGVVDNAGPGAPGKQAAGTLHFTGGAAADPNAQIADQSLAGKLLQTGDAGDTVVEKRQTSALESVY
jgi:Protein of unknown function (DUF3035)